MEYTGKTVQIMAMSECPNHCEHCFIGYKGHIPFDELETIMEVYTQKYEKVILNGTELLIDEKYIALCEKYHQDYIYTNGRLLTPQTRQMLKKHKITRISISLHYGIQEQISKSSLKEISKIIRDTIAEGFKVRVLCTVSKGNYKLIPEIADYVHSLGVKSLKLINLIYEGKGKNFCDDLLNRQEIEEFFELLYQTRQRYDKNELYISRNGGFGDDIYHKNNFNCPGGQQWVTILPDHTVHPCNGMLNEEHTIGYWDTTGIYIDKPFNHDCKFCTVLSLQINKAK